MDICFGALTILISFLFLLTNDILFIWWWCSSFLLHTHIKMLLLFTHEPIVIWRNWQLWYLIILNWTYPYPLTISTIRTLSSFSVVFFFFSFINEETNKKKIFEHWRTVIYLIFCMSCSVVHFKVVCYCFSSYYFRFDNKNYPH